MQIILNQTEIEQALVSYIATRLAINEGQEIVVEMTAGRGADGYRATVEIKDAAQAAAVTPAVQAPKPTPAPAVPIARKPKAEDPAKPAQAESKSVPAEEQTASTDAPFDGGTNTNSGSPLIKIGPVPVKIRYERIAVAVVIVASLESASR